MRYCLHMYFVTGNESKFQEAVAFLPNIKKIHLDLPEIQELDPKLIIQEKVAAAKAQGVSDFIVEDTSLYFDGLNGFPGPLVKWTLQALHAQGLFKFAQAFNIKMATAKTVIGYSKPNGETIFVEGTTIGTIVSPRGEHGFGWDGIFLPSGYTKTYAEMSMQEKIVVSHRTKALKALVTII